MNQNTGEKKLNPIIMRVPSGGCHLLSVDDETFHACWIRRHDTGRSNILPKK